MKEMRRSVATLLGAAVLAGCGGSSLEAEWPGPPRPSADGTVAVGSFNKYLDEYEDYASSPEALATEFLRLDERDAAATSLLARAGGVVVVTLDGLADDSIRSERYELVVEKQGSNWRLVSARQTQRCQAGRGHQDFSAELCV
jgi:hypothetical protein